MGHHSSSGHHSSGRPSSTPRFAASRPQRYQSLKITAPMPTPTPERAVPTEISHHTSVQYGVGQNGQLFGLVAASSDHPHVHVHADSLAHTRLGHAHRGEELTPPTRSLRLPR